MTIIKIEIDKTEMDIIIARNKDKSLRKAVNREAAKHLHATIKQAYATKGNIINTSWRPLSKKWAARKGHSRILYWKGILDRQINNVKSGFKTIINLRSFRVRLSKRWIKKYASVIAGNKRLPMRQIFGVNESTNRNVAEEIVYLVDPKRK
ncbi:MAG: hypothetical protein HC877_20700 [Thioploca sp.]|nr:hypothetical protein [Thioploca sp.]